MEIGKLECRFPQGIVSCYTISIYSVASVAQIILIQKTHIWHIISVIKGQLSRNIYSVATVPQIFSIQKTHIWHINAVLKGQLSRSQRNSIGTKAFACI